MTVSIIGPGMIGSTVARQAVKAGHRAIISNSRGPASLRDLVDELVALPLAGDDAEAKRTVARFHRPPLMSVKATA